MKTNFPRHEFHNDGFTGILSVSSWSFDGTFRKSLTSIPLGVLPSHSKDFSIFDLPIYPIQFASDEVVKAIRNRGKMFWRCRFRNYVSYSSEGDGGIYNTVSCEHRISNHWYQKGLRLIRKQFRSTRAIWLISARTTPCIAVTQRETKQTFNSMIPKTICHRSTCHKMIQICKTIFSCVCLPQFQDSIC